ncbi:hypothetical protein ZEAMMB73_Zm00001d033584 [Zea mays]|uniref:Uncharacterized protein n=1 Tax=Zea mays TaxID=4577 RepID=A0A1D6L081_MAIZE|nr:hypothetical protein ZEAMMB73_Zm00001d033584 [Zea mays]
MVPLRAAPPPAPPVGGSPTPPGMLKVAASGSTATPLRGGASVDDHLSAYCYFFSSMGLIHVAIRGLDILG